MTTYEKLLCAAAEYEVEQLKKSGQKFILDKKTFNPTLCESCFYGQVFKTSYSNLAMNFKHENNIPTGLCERAFEFSSQTTALESLMVRLWNTGKEDQVYKIVEQFATWNDEVSAEENLFTL